MENSDFKIGSIVALKSHPFEETTTNILISGEPLHLSPLMVIVEMLFDSKQKFGENKGAEVTSLKSEQCKCIWFSSKAQQFEDAWISLKLLKIIRVAVRENDDEPSIADLKHIGSTVSLITTKLELGKRKSTIEHFDHSDSNKKKISALLSFVCPPLEVVGYSVPETKESIIDTKTGKQKRFISKLLIKCKYYNSYSEKFSEALIPVEALMPVPAIDPAFLAQLTNLSSSGFFTYPMQNVNDKDDHNITLATLGNVNCRSGYYYIDVHDVVNNHSFEVPINELAQFREFENKNKLHSKYGFVTVKKGAISFEKVAYQEIIDIQKKIKNQGRNILYKIKYVGVNSRKSTVRFISHCTLHDEYDIVASPYQYIVAFCHTKNAIRCFRTDNIEEIQCFDLNPPKPIKKARPVKKLV